MSSNAPGGARRSHDTGQTEVGGARDACGLCLVGNSIASTQKNDGRAKRPSGATENLALGGITAGDTPWHASKQGSQSPPWGDNGRSCLFKPSPAQITATEFKVDMRGVQVAQQQGLQRYRVDRNQCDDLGKQSCHGKTS